MSEFVIARRTGLQIVKPNLYIKLLYTACDTKLRRGAIKSQSTREK